MADCAMGESAASLSAADSTWLSLERRVSGATSGDALLPGAFLFGIVAGVLWCSGVVVVVFGPGVGVVGVETWKSRGLDRQVLLFGDGM